MNKYNFDHVRDDTKKKVEFDHTRDADKKRAIKKQTQKDTNNVKRNCISTSKSSDVIGMLNAQNATKTSANCNRSTQKSRKCSIVATIAVVFLLIMAITIVGSTNLHKEHKDRFQKMLENKEYDNVVATYNIEIIEDKKCKESIDTIISAYSATVFSDYIEKDIKSEQAMNTLNALLNINNNSLQIEITNLLAGITQIDSSLFLPEGENNPEPIGQNVVDISQKETVFLDECNIVEKGEYQGNLGDSFVYPIGEHQYTRGNTDIMGNSYQHGIEAWIARWNYTDESSWAYATFLIPNDYKFLSGKVVLIDSYNTTNFDSTLYFYDADTENELEKYDLSPSSIPFDFMVNVENVKKLKIYVSDNRAASGGTSFGLIDALLTADNADEISIDDSNLQQSIPVDAFEWNQHKYYIYSNAESWEDAEEYCRGLGGHLAVISTKEENKAVFNYMKSLGIENAYFGLSDSQDEGNWNWIDGTSVKYLNWHSPNEPNSENQGEDYAMFYYKYPDGTWNDGDFGGSTVNGGVDYICEWDF
mgnify:CR=1 FL=1